MVTKDQVVRGVAAYYNNEIIGAAKGLAKFTAVFFLPSVATAVEQYLTQFMGNPLADGMITPSGLIDLETVRERAVTAMNQCGCVEVAGIRFRNDDIQRLYDYIVQA